MNKISITKTPYKSKQISIPTEIIFDWHKKIRQTLECLSISGACDSKTDTHTSYELPDFLDITTIIAILLKLFNIKDKNILQKVTYATIEFEN